MGDWVRTSSYPTRLLTASLGGFSLVFAALLAVGRPGLGLGQAFYATVILAALATGPLGGALAGGAAFALYETAFLVTGRQSLTAIVGERGVTHLAGYVGVGVLVGYSAGRARTVMAAALEVIDDLLVAAKRDVVTGTATATSFGRAIDRRTAWRSPFVLLVGDAPSETVVPEQALRDAARLIARRVGEAADVARVGPTQYAALLDGDVPSARAECAELERAFDATGLRMTFGWASHPADGRDALTLLRAANERLCARRIVRGEWRPTAVEAELVDAFPARPPGDPQGPPLD